MDKIFNERTPGGVIFQQDIAALSDAPKFLMIWLKTKRMADVKSPPRDPDFNAIKYLWFQLCKGTRVHKTRSKEKLITKLHK